MVTSHPECTKFLSEIQVFNSKKKKKKERNVIINQDKNHQGKSRLL